MSASRESPFRFYCEAAMGFLESMFPAVRLLFLICLLVTLAVDTIVNKDPILFTASIFSYFFYFLVFFSSQFRVTEAAVIKHIPLGFPKPIGGNNKYMFKYGLIVKTCLIHTEMTGVGKFDKTFAIFIIYYYSSSL